MMEHMSFEVKENIPLSGYSVFKIGGPARYFAIVHNEEDLLDVLCRAKEKNLPVFILGAGSNILASDKGFPGLVVKMDLQGLYAAEGGKLTAESGVSMARAVSESVKAGRTGFEWAIGVPGTIGGSVRGNAGCFGEEMKDVVSRVAVLDRFSLLKSVLTNGDCRFGYRDSLFKHNPNFVILSAILELAKGDALESQKKILEYSAHVIPEASQSELFTDGMLVAGDAGGLLVNSGVTLRGVDMAIASGAAAAKATKNAFEKNDFSKKSLSYYEELLKNDFVLQDRETFKKAPEFLQNERLYTMYPEFMCRLFHRIALVNGPKKRVFDELLEETKGKRTQMFLDMLRALRAV